MKAEIYTDEGLAKISGSTPRPISYAVTMQPEKGSATVTVALFGVSPNRWGGRFHSPIGAPRRLLPARRRDADGSDGDDRAPHLQLYRAGSGFNPGGSALVPGASFGGCDRCPPHRPP